MECVVKYLKTGGARTKKEEDIPLEERPCSHEYDLIIHLHMSPSKRKTHMFPHNLPHMSKQS
ncbi:uncharacterized protein G2W53_020731 [Senna tora]|uniref:Uncharacterized protein n=1 Tax=Senna tora TaxID=362788 RepID=A0A834TJS7_9FABA|nr:uncharacterized protein G2W53_020731 [Senna tora]